MLLEAAEGTHCSMEVLDDVVEHGPTENHRLVQSKSALTDNPVADRATSLWKSLFNWLQLSVVDSLTQRTRSSSFTFHDR